jgi:hypothetical protein
VSDLACNLSFNQSRDPHSMPQAGENKFSKKNLNYQETASLFLKSKKKSRFDTKNKEINPCMMA